MNMLVNIAELLGQAGGELPFAFAISPAELDDELQPIGESSSSDGALYEHWKVQVDSGESRS